MRAMCLKKKDFWKDTEQIIKNRKAKAEDRCREEKRKYHFCIL